MALALVLVCMHETIPHVRGDDSVDENYRFIPAYVGMTLGGQTNNGFNLFLHTCGDDSLYTPFVRFAFFCSSFGCE